MELPDPGRFAFILALGIASAILVFAHADKKGNRRATAWGIFAFFFGLPGVAVYFLAQRWRGGRR